MSPPTLTVAIAAALVVAAGLHPASAAEAASPKTASGCAVPSSKADPAPSPEPAELVLLARTERFLAPIARQPFTAWFARAPLEKLLPGAAGIAAVLGTAPVGTLPFPRPGSRRIVCLADGSTALEQVLDYEPGRRLRYIVWKYTTPAAAAIAYGVGEFRFADAQGGTSVEWTYSFRLKEDRFPGSLGAFGRGLFRIAFLDTRYAHFMNAGAAAIASEGVAAARKPGESRP